MHFSRSSLPPLASLLPFEAAARLQSITEAAREMGLTQAAISKQIKALEESLGIALFERRNRAVHLTREGQHLQQVVHSAMGEISAACTTLRAKSTDAELVLRAQQCEAIYWLMPRLSRFYRSHPNIDLRISVSTQPLAHADEAYDLALQSINRDQGGATLVHSASDEIFPVCSPEYLPLGTALSAADLDAHRLLHHHATRQDWMTWDEWLGAAGLPPRDIRKDQTFDSYSMVMQAAVEGHGIALGWHRTCEHLLRTGALIRPCIDALHLPDGLGLYAPRPGALPAKAQMLLDWLKTELGDAVFDTKSEI